MPEDSKKQQKGKHEPKEQRKSRRSAQNPAHIEAKVEIHMEAKTETKLAANPVPSRSKPEYESPGPEFYKNLKRETDEILKITEEENTKYKKKEIISNWSKYEMPIESYEEIEEHENMGADYEKLIAAPLSAGGHFQFKHEKSWDTTTGPSLYDNYFDIDMYNLSNALCTIPFYERNFADLDIFSDTDILTMNNRATRFKQKYFNDKSYTTPELEAQEKILNNMNDSFKPEENVHDKEEKYLKDIHIETLTQDENIVIDNIADNKNTATQDTFLSNSSIEEFEDKPNITKNLRTSDLLDIEHRNKSRILSKNAIPPSPAKTSDKDIVTEVRTNNDKIVPKEMIDELCDLDDVISEKETKASVNVYQADPVAVTNAAATPNALKNPVIESPEDLEKWLDDFLDG